MSHRYHLLYTLEPHPEGLTQDDFPKGGINGATDAVVFASILYGEDGSSSTVWISGDGRTGKPLDSGKQFAAWATLAAKLMDDPKLGGDQRSICAEAFGLVREMVLSRKDSP